MSSIQGYNVDKEGLRFHQQQRPRSTDLNQTSSKDLASLPKQSSARKWEGKEKSWDWGKRTKPNSLFSSSVWRRRYLNSFLISLLELVGIHAFVAGKHVVGYIPSSVTKPRVSFVLHPKNVIERIRRIQPVPNFNFYRIYQKQKLRDMTWRLAEITPVRLFSCILLPSFISWQLILTSRARISNNRIEWEKDYDICHNVRLVRRGLESTRRSENLKFHGFTTSLVCRVTTEIRPPVPYALVRRRIIDLFCLALRYLWEIEIPILRNVFENRLLNL